VLQTRGVSVAVLSCDAIARLYWAGPAKTGSAPCDTEDVAADVRAAKARADLVIVYPHWGVEYRARPTRLQREQAARWTEAGADIIIGNHAHWAAAAEQVNGKLVFYALGNFVFDQTWSERTMEGMVLELTFHGTSLRQAWIHPTLLIDQSQPNFLDPAGDGTRVVDQVRQASEGLLPY
jgi:poly-gamma-glutamate capsule biosynthesis protein CapA/YwtB (metallophosphatase superfamily)